MGQFAGLRVFGRFLFTLEILPKMVIDEKWFNKIESRLFTLPIEDFLCHHIHKFKISIANAGRNLHARCSRSSIMNLLIESFNFSLKYASELVQWSIIRARLLPFINNCGCVRQLAL